jgi:hypothetical protein
MHEQTQPERDHVPRLGSMGKGLGWRGCDRLSQRRTSTVRMEEGALGELRSHQLSSFVLLGLTFRAVGDQDRTPPSDSITPGCAGSWADVGFGVGGT